MLAIALSWTVIFYIFISAGDCLSNIFNKICRKNETYNLVDTFILGMYFTLIPLQLSSIWLPSNHYILLVYFIFSFIYWVFNKNRLFRHWKNITKITSSIDNISTTFIFASLLVISFALLFLTDAYDSEFYHHQNIRWNEEFAVVPGLANLEDRFGFNSNYMLLSALFSFRFLFGEAIYSLHTLLYILLLGWSFWNLIKHQFQVEYILLIFLFIIVYINGNTLLDNTSTDTIPLLCSFYIGIKTVISPQWLKKQTLLAVISPIALVTFKLSTVFLCIISAVVLINLIKNKDYRTYIFLFSTSSIILFLWCVRNIYITGYLVYPLHQIDIFTFDWKMPKSTLMLQQAYIHDYASFTLRGNLSLDLFFFELETNKILAFGKLTNWIIYIFVLISPITVIYSFVKKKTQDSSIYFIYTVLLTSIIFSLISAPDIRFMYGYILGCTFIHIYILLSLRREERTLNRYKYLILFSFLLFISYSAYKVNRLVATYMYESDRERLATIFVKPLTHPRTYDYKRKYTIYKLGHISIFLTPESHGRTFDKIATSTPLGTPFDIFDGNKVQSIKTIENRGNSLQDGFRTKKEFIELLNKNGDKYKKEYQEYFNKTYYKK